MGVQDVNDDSYQREVLQEQETPVVVDFWGEGCPPCMMIKPIIEELAAELAGKVKFVKAKAEENAQQAVNLQIMAVPTLLFYVGGELKDKSVGFLSKDKLRKKIDSVFSL